MEFPKHILLVEPVGYRVEYAINPHMKDGEGNLNQVDQDLAQKQWSGFRSKLEELGLKVSVHAGDERFPDMVFCANQFFTSPRAETKLAVLSHMASVQRQGEVSLLEEFLKKSGHEIVRLESDDLFEGMGDLLWDYGGDRLFGGHGFRTKESVYGEIEKLIGREIVTLQLVSEHFYHLDTCLSILNEETALYLPAAFDEKSCAKLKNSFKNLIEIDFDEAKEKFALNLFCPDGRNIIVQKDCSDLKKKLAGNFVIHELDSSEFIKAGGSFFCMKHQLF